MTKMFEDLAKEQPKEIEYQEVEDDGSDLTDLLM